MLELDPQEGQIDKRDVAAQAWDGPRNFIFKKSGSREVTVGLNKKLFSIQIPEDQPATASDTDEFTY